MIEKKKICIPFVFYIKKTTWKIVKYISKIYIMARHCMQSQVRRRRKTTTSLSISLKTISVCTVAGRRHRVGYYSVPEVVVISQAPSRESTATSDTDSTPSLASCTIADTVSLATTLRTARRGVIGWAVTCDFWSRLVDLTRKLHHSWHHVTGNDAPHCAGGRHWVGHRAVTDDIERRLVYLPRASLTIADTVPLATTLRTVAGRSQVEPHAKRHPIWRSDAYDIVSFHNAKTPSSVSCAPPCQAGACHNSSEEDVTVTACRSHRCLSQTHLSLLRASQPLTSSHRLLGNDDPHASRQRIISVTRSIPSGTAMGACSQTSIPSNSCAMTSMMLTTAFRIPLSRSLLLSPSRISKTSQMPEETPLGTSARYEVWSVLRSTSVRCWHVSGPDASQPTSIAPVPCKDDVVIRVVGRGKSRRVFLLSDCRRNIHSQDHGLSHTCTCTRSTDSVMWIQTKTRQTVIDKVWHVTQEISAKKENIQSEKYF